MFYLGFVVMVIAGIATGSLLTERFGSRSEPELWVWEDLSELFDILLRSGMHCGFAVFTHNRSGHFL